MAKMLNIGKNKTDIYFTVEIKCSSVPKVELVSFR